MKFGSSIIGIVMAAALLALLGLTRLLVPAQQVVDIDVREIDITTLPEPPPPPPEEPPPDIPPPPPSLTQVAQLPDPTRVAIPKADVPLDLKMPVDSFFTDIEPAPLPQPVVRKAPPATRITPTVRSQPKPPPAPVAKSHYSIGELDGKPRLIRHGSAQFPSSLSRRGINQGTVVFEVELSERGRVSVRRVLSSTHADLVAPARRVASSASFTPPTRQGQQVKAVMKWPITLRK